MACANSGDVSLAVAGPTLLTSRAPRHGVADAKRDEIAKRPIETVACKMLTEEKTQRADGVEEGEALAEVSASALQPPKVVSDVAAGMLADDSSSEADEEEPRSGARLAAEKKAAADEVFWTAAQRALHERERRQRVGAFLKQHGFSSVHAKQGWWSYTYPLHVAAELGDADLVQMILDSKAPRRRRDSSGKTARMLAKAANRNGSHDAVIEVLKYSQSRRVRCNAPVQEVMSIEPPAPKVMSVELTALKASAAPQRTMSNQPSAALFGRPSAEAMDAAEAELGSCTPL